MGILNWKIMALYIKLNIVSSHEIHGSVYRVMYCTEHVPVLSTIQYLHPYISSRRTNSKNVEVHMPLTRLLAGFRGMEWRGNLVWGEVLRTHHQACHIRRFRNIDIELSYEYAPSRINIFETGVTLPGRAEISLAATASCRLHLFALLICYVYLLTTVYGRTGSVSQHVASMLGSRL